MILGVGLQYYQEWTLYVPQMCVENDVPSELGKSASTTPHHTTDALTPRSGVDSGGQQHERKRVWLR